MTGNNTDDGYLEPAETDNTEPRCNIEQQMKYGSNNRCEGMPVTAFRIPDSGLYVYVCKRHVETVTDLHPDAEEVGL